MHRIPDKPGAAGLRACFACAAVFLALAAPAQARIIGDIRSIGFASTRNDGTGQSGIGTIRTGAWIPVTVDLTLEEAPSFEGFVRLQQRDRDGDLCYDQVAVNLRLDGVSQKRCTLYVLANPGQMTADAFDVSVLNEDGHVVEVFSSGVKTPVIRPAQPPVVLPDDECLILSVSSTSIGKVLALQDERFRDQFVRPCSIAPLSPADLPRLWCGLEMVDCIVWDDADTTEVTPEQLEAVIEWTRQGGTLLVAASRTAAAVRQSPLHALLPVEIGTEKDAVDDMPAIRRTLLGESEQTSWPTSVDVVRCAPKRGAGLIPAGAPPDEPALYSARLGRGTIVFAPFTLRSLFVHTDDEGAGRLLERVLGLRRDREASVRNYLFTTRHNLFQDFEKTIGFADLSAWYLLLALGFAGAYVLGTTWGIWSLFLRRRELTKHSWTAFAATALLGSVASITGVQFVRGIRPTDLRQLTIVDIRPGDVRAYATSYFGLKTNIDSELDLWLPSDHLAGKKPSPTTCSLRPMPVGADVTQLAGSYADPRRYRVEPANAVIQNVPFRATLKQLEGRWDGVLRGRVDASIRLVDGSDDHRDDIRLSDDSWITNELGVPLTNCFLLQPIPHRIGIANERHDEDIYALHIRELPSGEKVTLAPRIYQDQTTGAPLPFAEWSATRTLKAAQSGWTRSYRSTLSQVTDRKAPKFNLSQYQDAVLLLSTLTDYNPPAASTSAMMIGEWIPSLARARQLDLSGCVDERHCVLIGFAQNDPGPVRLCYRGGGSSDEDEFDPIEPRQAWTVYRIVIPIESSP